MAAGAGKLASWVVPVGAGVAVVAVIGAAFLLVGGGSGDSSAAGESAPPTSSTAATSAATTTTGATSAAPTSVPPDNTAAGAFSGVTTFNFDPPNGIGKASVSVTCAGDCTVSVDEVTGHNEAVRTWVVAAMGHTYTAAGDGYRFVGGKLTSCDQLGSNWTDPSLWSADLTITDGRVSITAVMPGFTAPRCGSSRTELTFTGTPS